MARKGDGIYKRGKCWRLDCWINGVRYRMPLGKNISRSAALELASIRRAAILRGEAGIHKKKDIQYDKAMQLFLAASKVNNRINTYRGYAGHLRNMGAKFGGLPLSKISAFSIEGYKKDRKEADTLVAFNRELGTLKTMFNWCIDKGFFDGPNPCRQVKKFAESDGNERFLSYDEEQELLRACREPLRTLVMCGIYAGLRIPSEVLHLQWADIDLQNSLLSIQGAFAKSGKTETIPMNSKLREALATLKDRSARKSEYVFVRTTGKPFKSIQNIFRKAAEKTGLGDISPHVCRHTFASRLAMAGVDLRTIQKLGRWSNLSMVQRYANLSKTHLSQAIEALSRNSPPFFPTLAENAPQASNLRAV